MSWPVVSSQDLHRDDWVVALREDVITRPGHPEQFSRISLEHPGAVVVLAVDDDERVMCLRQYRHTSGHQFVELPAGLRDADDEPSVETARRELREEVELDASRWKLLLSTYSSAGISDEVHDIFLARGLTHAARGDFEPCGLFIAEDADRAARRHRAFALARIAREALEPSERLCDLIAPESGFLQLDPK